MFEEGHSSSTHSTQLCWALARYDEATDQLTERDEWIARGVALVRSTLAMFKDIADVKAYSSLQHNRGLLEAAKQRRSSGSSGRSS
jgi:hypothetical protein